MDHAKRITAVHSHAAVQPQIPCKCLLFAKISSHCGDIRCDADRDNMVLFWFPRVGIFQPQLPIIRLRVYLFNRKYGNLLLLGSDLLHSMRACDTSMAHGKVCRLLKARKHTDKAEKEAILVNTLEVHFWSISWACDMRDYRSYEYQLGLRQFLNLVLHSIHIMLCCGGSIHAKLHTSVLLLQNR